MKNSALRMEVLGEMSNLKFVTPNSTGLRDKLLYENTVLHFAECSNTCYMEQVQNVSTYALLL